MTREQHTEQRAKVYLIREKGLRMCADLGDVIYDSHVVMAS